MTDPAYDYDDYKQDAEVAILANRLTPKGVGAAIANAKRTQYRKQRCRRERQPAVHHYQKQVRRGERDPMAVAADQERATTCVKKLYDRDPRLLAIILMRALDMPRAQIASITGRSEGTISRAPRRAAWLCQ